MFHSPTGTLSEDPGVEVRVVCSRTARLSAIACTMRSTTTLFRREVNGAPFGRVGNLAILDHPILCVFVYLVAVIGEHIGSACVGLSGVLIDSKKSVLRSLLLDAVVPSPRLGDGPACRGRCGLEVRSISFGQATVLVVRTADRRRFAQDWVANERD